MCGILSISLNEEKNLNLSTFKASLDHQKYRGPDAQKILKITPNTIFGFNRLAIQDLDERSMQPFEHNENKLIFNGEIYNFLELKQELLELGHEFKTTGDTEVLIHVLDQWGVDGVKKLNGIFAFVYYNQNTNELWVARDGMGIKPLYYYQGQMLIFASDVGSITKFIKPEISENTLCSNFIGDWLISNPDETYFKNVKQLPAGNIAVFDNQSLDLKNETSFFERKFDKIISEENEASNLYLPTLKKIIEAETQSDAVVGCTLSGGTDSTTVLTLATPHLLKKQARIPVFTVNDVGAEDDLEASLKTIQELTKIYGDVYDHHIVDLTAPITLQDIQEATISMGRPVNDIRFVTMKKFFNAVKDNGIKVILTGQGSDELNYGYHPLKTWPLTNFYTSDREFTSKNVFEEFCETYKRKLSYFNPNFSQKALERFKLYLDEIFLKISHIKDKKQKITAFLGHTELQNVFGYEDHSTMYNGIEARVPLANSKLVTIADSISPLLHLKSSESGRHFLRLALKAAGLSDEIANRKKVPTPKKRNYLPQLKRILEENKTDIVTSDLIKTVFSDEFISNLLNNQTLINETTEAYQMYGNMEDILLNVLGLWQFEKIFLKNN